jgi:hypothetical protein
MFTEISFLYRYSTRKEKEKMMMNENRYNNDSEKNEKPRNNISNERMCYSDLKDLYELTLKRLREIREKYSNEFTVDKDSSQS